MNRYPKLKIYISELILDSYKYIPVEYITMQCSILTLITLCRSNLNPYCMGRKVAFFSVGIQPL
jgi:hypothetical protein